MGHIEVHCWKNYAPGGLCVDYYLDSLRICRAYSE